MATIRSQMMLNDGMSSVLKKITGALDITLHSFEQVQRASGRAVNVAQIAQARSQLVGANAQLDEMAENYRRAAQQEEILNKGLRNGAIAADGLLGKVKGIAATLAAGVGVQKVLGLSDQLASGSARLSLIVDDGGTVDMLEQKIMASAQRSRAPYLDTMQTVSKLGLQAGDAFGSNDELLRFTELLNKNFVIGGTLATEQAAAMYQLTQAMGSGRLQGDEYRSIIEHAPLLATAIEDYMRNVQGAEGSMKDWASEGLLTAGVIKAAVFDSADEIEARFEQMPMTWGQIWTSMQNKVIAAFEPVLARLNQVANSGRFATVTDGIVAGLATIAAVAGVVLDLLISGGSLVVDNWSWIEPIVWGLVAAFIAYNTVALITNGINRAMALADGVKAAALAMSTGAAFAATVAQYGLNAALLACPITWIVLLVIALVAAFYAAVAAINHFAGTSVSATGVICGVVAVAGAFIVNTAIGLINALIQITWMFVSPFLGIVEWILNVCNGGFNSFGGAVANLIGQIIGWFLNLGKIVTTIIDAIFGTNWTAGLETLQGTVTAWGKNENAITLDKNVPTIDYRIEYGVNGGGAWQAGNDFGKGIEDKIGGMFSLGNENAFDYAGMMGDVGSIADSTGSMAEALDVSNEQLEYLRDIAERDAINRFTTAEVKIDMTGMTNKIDGSADLDGVISQLTEGFTEALLTAAEGVHA